MADARAKPRPLVVGIGELLWDLLPGGERLGGAPFNTVAHLRRLGWRAAYVTGVGDDERGARALAEMGRLGVDTRWVQRTRSPTGVARVRLGQGGDPQFEIVSPAAYETARPDQDSVRTLDGADLLVFGTLAQRFSAIRETTERVAARAEIRLYDVNLRSGRWDAALVDGAMRTATVVKMNEAEAAAIAAELGLPAAPEAFCRDLAAKYALEAACVTFGARGAALLLGESYSLAAGVTVDVADTVGAGDAFAAALGHGLFNRWPAGEILSVSNRLGALVASRQGAIPDWAPPDIGLSARP